MSGFASTADLSDKPVTHVVLSHHHAVRVLGASAYAGAEVVASGDGRRSPACSVYRVRLNRGQRAT